MTTGYPDPPTPLLDLPGWLKRAKKPLFSVHNDNSWLIGQFMHMRGIPKVIRGVQKKSGLASELITHVVEELE